MQSKSLPIGRNQCVVFAHSRSKHQIIDLAQQRVEYVTVFEKNSDMDKKLDDKFSHKGYGGFCGTWILLGTFKEQVGNETYTRRVVYHSKGQDFFVDLDIFMAHDNGDLTQWYHEAATSVSLVDVPFVFPNLSPIPLRIDLRTTDLFAKFALKKNFKLQFDGDESAKKDHTLVSQNLVSQFDWFTEIMQPNGPTLRNLIGSYFPQTFPYRRVSSEALSLFFDYLGGQMVKIPSKCVQEFNWIHATLNDWKKCRAHISSNIPDAIKREMNIPVRVMVPEKHLFSDGNCVTIVQAIQCKHIPNPCPMLDEAYPKLAYLNGVYKWANTTDTPVEAMKSFWMNKNCAAMAFFEKTTAFTPSAYNELQKLEIIPSKEHVIEEKFTSLIV